MLLFIPVSKADYHLAGPLFRLMEQLGGIGEHTMVVATTPEGIPAVEEEHLILAAKRLGPKVYPIKLANNPEYGWPRSANLIFQEAATYASINKAHGESCWYFYELDNCPTRPTWLEELQEEYDFRGRPCLGVINATARVRAGQQIKDGEHMVGTGIYPPDFTARARITRHLHLLADPFDVALQYQVVPMAWDTNLIQHNWSTKNYKQEGNFAVCEPATSRPTSQVYAKPVKLSVNGPCVVHGCKDTSLIRIVSHVLQGPPLSPDNDTEPKRRRRRSTE